MNNSMQILTDDEIRGEIHNAIGFGFEPGELQSVNADDLMTVAHALLSKLRAPVADERAAFEKLVSQWNQPLDRAGWGYEDPKIQDAWWIWNMSRGTNPSDTRAALASAPVAGEQIIAWDVQDTGLGRRYTTYNPKVAEDLMNLGENVRPLVYASALPPANAAPQASAVAGEAQGWSGWACQYPNKLPRLYGAKEIAQLNCDAANGDRVLFLSEHAAPQASADDVRNAALEEAAKLMDQTLRSNGAALIRGLKRSQADKDSGQQRAGDAVEPIAWECTTHVFFKYVTDSKYRKFRPDVQKWYRPYRCASCAALSAPQGSE